MGCLFNLTPLSTDNLVSILTTVIGALAVLGITWFGIRRWRVEQVERRQIEVAEEALSLVYESEDVFNSIRSPLVTSNEYAERVPETNETKDEISRRNTYYATIKRINAFRPYFERVSKIYPVYRAVFGKSTSAPLREIFLIRNEIIISAEMLADRRDIGEEDQATKDMYRKQRENIWAAGTKNSEDPSSIENRIKKLTAELEAQATPLLKTRYRVDKSA